MGSGVSTAVGSSFYNVAIDEVAKADPDGKDLRGFDDAKAEVIRLRALVRRFSSETSGSVPKGETSNDQEKAATRIQNIHRANSAKRKVATEANDESLRAVFHAYASFGHRNETVYEMEGKNFIKMCKETKLLGKRLTTTDCDLIFTSVKAKGSKKITYAQWRAALKKCSEKLGMDLAKVLKQIVVHGVPGNSGTQAQYNKFYDDKSTWGQGVHSHGGPEVLSSGPTLASQANRSNKADVRGVVKYDK